MHAVLNDTEKGKGEVDASSENEVRTTFPVPEDIIWWGIATRKMKEQNQGARREELELLSPSEEASFGHCLMSDGIARSVSPGHIYRNVVAGGFGDPADRFVGEART